MVSTLETQPTVIEALAAKHASFLHQGFHDRSHLLKGEMEALGDARWTDQLILATWYQAEHGCPPDNGLEYRLGNSGGGFDVLDFKLLDEGEWLDEPTSIDTSIPPTAANPGTAK